MEAVNRPELQGEEAESPFQIDCTGYSISHICL